MNDEQQTRVLEVVDDLPWEDVENAIRVVLNMRLLLDATQDSLLVWEAEADERGFHDEYLLSPGDVRDLSEQWRAAYVARLIKNLALVYGVGDISHAGEAAPVHAHRHPAQAERHLMGSADDGTEVP